MDEKKLSKLEMVVGWYLVAMAVLVIIAMSR